MVHAVALDRARREHSLPRAARAAVHTLVGRVGMALTRREVET
jgi:hypothetical protein